jgi:hypothetical protein
MMFTSTIALMFSLASAELYCPSKDDIQGIGRDIQGEQVEIYDGGWTFRRGYAGAVLNATFNLSNGYIEYDVDFSGVSIGVNAHLYGIFPNVSGSHYTPDDVCGHGEYQPWCPEIDFIESNGDCGGATTLHTNSGPGGCSTGPGFGWGCKTAYHYYDEHSIGSAAFHMRIDFDASGEIIVRRWHKGGHGVFDELDGDDFHPKPDATAYRVIKAAHETTGMAIVSAQWQGETPVTECGTWPGDIDNSTFSVRNLKIAGKLVRGPAPPQCSVLV